MRAALVTKNGCWSALCLHREDVSHGFDAREIDLIRRISPHVAEGLRRAVTIGPAAAVGAEAVPGMIILDANLTVVSMRHISAHTVQEHLTAAFDKLGVRGRRELAAAVLTGHH